ncbi:MAG: glycosyltransferase family protein [Rhodobacteraceae bacterium]|nr:glycosyltransferase family protein [Paracoccaceae bacterium]
MVSAGGIPVHVEHGARSAAVAYNRGLDATDAPFVIFAHQDVYFPPGWDRRLAETLAILDAADPS